MKDYGELYRAARAGEHAAQDELVRRHWAELGRFVERIVGPAIREREDPEDLRLLALETFLRRLPGFPEELSEDEARARLFQIAKWSVGNVLKKERRETPVESWSRLAMDDSLPSRGTVTRADDRRKLEELLERMKPEYAEVLRRSVLEAKSLEVVASELAISEENARKRLQRAKAQLLEVAEHWRNQEAAD